MKGWLVKNSISKDEAERAMELRRMSPLAAEPGDEHGEVNRFLQPGDLFRELQRKLDEARNDNFMALASLIGACGGSVRVRASHVANVTPQTRVEWYDDPRTGDRVYRVVNTPTRD